MVRLASSETHVNDDRRIYEVKRFDTPTISSDHSYTVLTWEALVFCFPFNVPGALFGYYSSKSLLESVPIIRDGTYPPSDATFRLVACVP